jgi:5'-deoxynucleotidase YfbR-like HD superfamily hydrolase
VADVPGEAGVNPAIQTYSGRRFSPLEPVAEDIDVEDIAHALSNQCRFGGHCRAFYSVAQHSCVVSDVVGALDASPDDRLWALLHDASEAYLLDLPHPLKHGTVLGTAYRAIEAPLQAAILERFGLPAEPPPDVKAADRAVLASERLALMQEAFDWPELEGVEAIDLKLEPWLPARAAREFLERFARLQEAR